MSIKLPVKIAGKVSWVFQWFDLSFTDTHWDWPLVSVDKVIFLIYFRVFWKVGRRSSTMNRTSRQEVFCKKGVLRNFVKFTGKHLCQSFFFNIKKDCFFMNKDAIVCGLVKLLTGLFFLYKIYLTEIRFDINGLLCWSNLYIQ